MRITLIRTGTVQTQVAVQLAGLGTSLVATLVVTLAALSLAPVQESAAQVQSDQVVLPQTPTATKQTLRFKKMSIAEGLSQSTVYNILQDRQGYMWFATQDGLNRFDGYKNKVYRPIPFDTTSLSDGWVFDVYEDRAGNIWVGTYAGGLNRMDRTTETFTHFRHDDEDSTSLSNDGVFAVIEDRTGFIWVATNGGGLNRLDPETGVFRHFRHDPDDPSTVTNDEMWYLLEDSAGMIWASTTNGLNSIDPRTDAVTRYLFDPNDPSVDRGGFGGEGDDNWVFDMFESTTDPGVLWAGTGYGLLRLDTESSELKRFVAYPDAAQRAVNTVNAVREDPNDTQFLWVAMTGGGLARFDKDTGAFYPYKHDPEDSNSIASDDIISAYVDRSGMIWAGSATRGLNQFNPAAVDFTNIRHDRADASSLSSGWVWAIHEDRSGNLWVATENASAERVLTKFDRQTGNVVHYEHEPANPTSLSAGSIGVVYEDSARRLWVGTRGGLNRLDSASNRFARYTNAPDDPTTIRSGWVAEIVESRRSTGTLWIGMSTGVDRFDMSTNEFARVSLSDTAGIVGIRSLYEDSNGQLWVGTAADGLYRIDLTTDEVTHYKYEAGDANTISGTWIADLHERESEPGILWIGSHHGLNRLEIATGAVTHFDSRHGLPNNIIYGILEDDSGHLWMSTNNGISRFNVEERTFRNYGLDSGLQELEYQGGSAYAKGSGGVLYFGHVAGVTAFVPEQLKQNQIPPPVLVTDFRIHNESVVGGSKWPSKQSLSETDEIRLSHKQNIISFDFVAPHFANPAKNEYAYWLENFEDDWNYVGTQRTAAYTNLPAGKYVFHVKAANADGLWNDDGVSVSVIVRPPWWRTWWAYLLYGLTFAGGVFVVDRIQRARLSAKEQKRAQIREAELQLEAENERREDAERLSEIGRAITSTLSVRQIIDTVYENVNALMDAAVFGIGVYNQEANRIEFPASKEQGETLAPFFHRMDDDERLSVYCLRNEEEVVINDYRAEFSNYVSKDLPPVAGGSPESVLYLPLVHQGKRVGVITAQSFAKHAYSDYDVNILRSLASYAAIALDNANAYRQLGATVENLQSAQAQLIQSEKMASLGELTAGIAHEIKNPLNFVNNFAELNAELADELFELLESNPTALLDEAKDVLANIRNNAKKVRESGERADAIVRSMMLHARGDTGDQETVVVNDFVEEYVNLAYHGMRAQTPEFNVTIERDYDDSAPTVKLVPQEIGRVLINLLSNAFYAVHDQQAQVNGQYAPTVGVQTKRVGALVEIRISDNGSGIPDHVKDRIFEPFFTTKPTGSGTGLGLSLSYDIVTKGHGGSLTVNSAAGKGSTFVVSVPA